MARVQRKLLAGRRGAQSMVEFALTLPILLLVMFALIEAGRLLFYYSSVFTASREGARYGAAGGLLDDGSAFRYQDCAGIRAAARRVGFFAISSDEQIEIKYDRGPDDPSAWSALPNCSSGYTVSLGDRVVVRVTSTYTTLVPLLNFSGLTVQSLTGRTILKDIEVGGVYAPIGGGSGGGGGSTPTPTASPTATTSGGGGGGGGGGSTPTPTPTATPVTPVPVNCALNTLTFLNKSPNGKEYIYQITNGNTTSATISGMNISWINTDSKKPVSLSGISIIDNANKETTIWTGTKSTPAQGFSWSNTGALAIPGNNATRKIKLIFSAQGVSDVSLSVSLDNGCSVP